MIYFQRAKTRQLKYKSDSCFDDDKMHSLPSASITGVFWEENEPDNNKIGSVFVFAVQLVTFK